MKRLIVAALFILVAGSALEAQSMFLRASIPFEFHAGKTVMPAGRYVVEGKGGWVLLREEGSGKNACALMLHSAIRRDNIQDGRLTFSRYGDTYFLRSIWSGGSDGHELPQTSVEKELAKNQGSGPNAVLALSKH